MPLADECSKTREELIEELHQLRREVALLKSAQPPSVGFRGSVPEWPDRLVDKMDQSVVLLNPQGSILEVNQTAILGCGMDRQAIIGRPLWTLKCWQVSRDVNCQLRRAIRQSAAGEVTRYETEVYGAANGQEIITIDLTLKPLRGEAGEVVSILAEGRDITERKNAEREVERKTEERRILYEQLKEFDQLKTQFFANVSHELRTPLTLILGPVRKQLECSKIAQEHRRALKVVERNAGLLLQRVNNLLDLSKLEADEMQAQYSRVDLAKLGRLVASHFEVLAEERDLNFAVKMPEKMAAEVDPEKLQRVLLNLLSNAFKFTPNGGTIAFTLHAQGERVVFSVHDSGAGIVPQKRNSIFERFRQGEINPERPLSGTGLGLSIVKEFVLLHHGEVSVSESPTGGAAFIVELPIRAPGHAAVFAAAAGRDLQLGPANGRGTPVLPASAEHRAKHAPLEHAVDSGCRRQSRYERLSGRNHQRGIPRGDGLRRPRRLPKSARASAGPDPDRHDDAAHERGRTRPPGAENAAARGRSHHAAHRQDGPSPARQVAQ